MSWLLKIVEGPMKGAEVALVDGLKVKVGSGDSCDIVVADRSLDEVAFELDATESGVTLTRPSGETQLLAPFEVVSIFMLGVIQLMEPFSVISVSPGATSQMTTGSGSPTILYCIRYLFL
mgnify:CR=1 FL=1